MIRLTDIARQKFLEATRAEGREGHGLRVIVRGGGSSRPEFALNFVGPDEPTEGDTVVESDGVRIHADADSARWLDGASIDYVDSLQESGFKVDAPAAGPPRPAGPVAEAVQRVLDEQINPAVAQHGGHVSLVALEHETAYLRFGGGCQGCGMINVTLKQGVERLIFEAVPQVQKVLDVTDHAAGQNPYYQPSK